MRMAVSGLFFVNGIFVGSWAPKIPVLMHRLEISEAVTGLIVLLLGLGSISIMPVFGALTARRGSAHAVRLAAILLTPGLLLMSLAPNLPLVAVSVFLFGGMVGGMDVAMNANAVAVERVRRRAIMSSCHGFWSLGALIGSGAGGIVITWLGEIGHALLLTALFAASLAVLLPQILQDRPKLTDHVTHRRGLPRSPLPYLIGLMALCAMVPEGAILDWAAVYLQKEMGASLSLAGWGFAACAATMAAMRFAGDVIRQRFGAERTLRVSVVIAITGMGVAGAASNAPMAIIGFGLAGLGIANLVPIAFSAAGNLPGIAQGVGLSVVTMMGYSGILLAPGSIGFLAEKTSFSLIYLGLAVLLMVPLLLSPLIRSADFEAEMPRPD